MVKQKHAERSVGTPACNNYSRFAKSVNMVQHISKPKLVKRFNTSGSGIWKPARPMRTPMSPSLKLIDCQNPFRLPPQISSAIVPAEPPKSFIYVTPSSPMKLDKPVSEVIQSKFKSDS